MWIKVATNLRNSDGSLGCEEFTISDFSFGDSGVLRVVDQNMKVTYYSPAYWATVEAGE